MATSTNGSNGAELPVDDKGTENGTNVASTTPPRNSKGWDGKLRVEKKAVLANPEALSDPEYSDEDAPPVDQINADEDLLEDEDPETDQIDLVHCKIQSVPALHLERFRKVARLCLRQNQISDIELPAELSQVLRELDLYDNLIGHIKGLEELNELEILDLSFNKIKHIKRVRHLKKLKEIYFVQNKIGAIEGLEGLEHLRLLELGANRIRAIENLESLTSLEELWLGKNKITQLEGLDTLTNLTILSIQSNRLTSITGLDQLNKLEQLHISYNAITSISGLRSLINLRVIDISNNPIEHLEGLESQEHLEELWASYCHIGDFAEVEGQLKDKEELETVYFEGNPLQLRQPALYRNKIRLALPQVKQIDAS